MGFASTPRCSAVSRSDSRTAKAHDCRRDSPRDQDRFACTFLSGIGFERILKVLQAVRGIRPKLDYAPADHGPEFVEHDSVLMFVLPAQPMINAESLPGEIGIDNHGVCYRNRLSILNSVGNDSSTGLERREGG